MTKTTAANTTYPKGGVSCFADSFVVAENSVFRMKFIGKNLHLRVAAKRYQQPKKTTIMTEQYLKIEKRIIASRIMAHLFLPDTQAKRFPKPKEPFLANALMMTMQL